MAAVPADANALALLPAGNTGTQFIDDAGDFMPWNTGILNSWPSAFFREHVTVTDTTSLHFDEHVTCVRFRNRAFDDLEIASSFTNLRCLHWCYTDFCRCHKSSLEISALKFSAIVEKHVPGKGRPTTRCCKVKGFNCTGEKSLASIRESSRN
jgi:hypothetical protein